MICNARTDRFRRAVDDSMRYLLSSVGWSSLPISKSYSVSSVSIASQQVDFLRLFYIQYPITSWAHNWQPGRDWWMDIQKLEPSIGTAATIGSKRPYPSASQLGDPFSFDAIFGGSAHAIAPRLDSSVVYFVSRTLELIIACIRGLFCLTILI